MSQTLLDFDNVVKLYGSCLALKDFCLKVYPGERVAILGCNGAGKSTFVGLASGAVSPTKGEVRVFGQKPMEFEVRSRRRVLPQELAFPTSLKVKEILTIVDSHYEGSNSIIAAEQIGLAPLLDRYTGALSGGERRKLAFLCALAGRPSLVILDEPTANVDLIGQGQMHAILKKSFSENDSALIFSSHQMSEVESLATRVVVLNLGEILFDGPLEKVKQLFYKKKVRFFSPLSQLDLPSLGPVKRLGDGLYECFGVDSDAILRELLQNSRLEASRFEVFESGLEESILRLWEEGRSSRCL